MVSLQKGQGAQPLARMNEIGGRLSQLEPRMSGRAAGKLKNQCVFGPSRPRNTIEYGSQAGITILGKRRNYMQRQILKILAGHMIWDGRLRRPPPCGDPSCGPLVFSACVRMYVLFVPHIPECCESSKFGMSQQQNKTCKLHVMGKCKINVTYNWLQFSFLLHFWIPKGPEGPFFTF